MTFVTDKAGLEILQLSDSVNVKDWSCDFT